MSLINEALKRASQSQQEYDTVRINLPRASTSALNPQSAREIAPAPAPPAPKPQSTRDSAPKSKPEPTWGWPAESETKKGRSSAVPILVILLFVTAGAFFGIGYFSRKSPAHVAATLPVSHPVQAAAPVQQPAPPSPAEQAVATTAPAAEPATPPPPPPRVQGISYYNGKWQAIVNGKTVYVGNTVNGFRIAVISRNNVVFIAPDGSQEKVALGE